MIDTKSLPKFPVPSACPRKKRGEEPGCSFIVNGIHLKCDNHHSDGCGFRLFPEDYPQDFAEVKEWYNLVYNNNQEETESLQIEKMMEQCFDNYKSGQLVMNKEFPSWNEIKRAMVTAFNAGKGNK